MRWFRNQPPSSCPLGDESELRSLWCTCITFRSCTSKSCKGSFQPKTLFTAIPFFHGHQKAVPVCLGGGMAPSYPTGGRTSNREEGPAAKAQLLPQKLQNQSERQVNLEACFCFEGSPFWVVCVQENPKGTPTSEDFLSETPPFPFPAARCPNKIIPSLGGKPSHPVQLRFLGQFQLV